MGKDYSNYSNYSKNQNNRNTQMMTINNTSNEVKNEPILEEIIHEKKLGKVTANMVYLRNGSSINDEPLSILEKGQKVEILLKESTNDFYRVHVNDLDGYCMKKFIDIE